MKTKPVSILLALAVSVASHAQTPPTFTIVANSAIAQDATYGMSWGDYDNDGWIDLHSSGPTRNFLYHNNGDGTFTRVGSTNTIVSRTYGQDYSECGHWADYDNDGYLDLIVTTGQQFVLNRNQLFRNLGNGNFVFVTNAITTTPLASFDAAWADFNRDGWLDVFLSNIGSGGTSTENHFYFANSDGSFVRATGDGIPTNAAQNFGASVADYDGDGWPDLAAGTIPGQAIVLNKNRTGSAFDVNSITTGGNFVIGGAWGDYNNDGNLDLFAAYAGAVCKLLRNDGNGAFEQIFDGALPAEPGRANSATWGDYDNDGWLDLFVPRTAAYAGGTDNNDSLWHNNGDGTFTRVPAGSVGNDGVDSWGAAWGDYDNDGFLDLVVGCQDSNNGTVKNRLFHNNGNTNHWIGFNLVGTKSNRSALGAKVRVKATIKGQTFWQMREIGAGAVSSQNDLRAHFGLGNATQPNEIRIEWPSGLVTHLTNNFWRDQYLTITEQPTVRAKLLTNGNVYLSVDGLVRLQRATIERSQNLRDWTPIATVYMGIDSQPDFEDPVDPRATARFYRAVLVE